MKQYIQASNTIKKGIEHRLGHYDVIVSHDIDDKILIDTFKILKKSVPYFYSKLVDVVYVGQFDLLKSRDLNALYLDGAIFITNIQESVADMAEDIIHETAHAVEETYKHFIYSDGVLEREFLTKRQSLSQILQSEGHDISAYQFLDSSYSLSLDKLFYQDIGYPLLSILSANLFYSPYGATSLREYWANGFECYYAHKKADTLKKISNILYTKVVDLEEYLNENKS